LRLIFTIFTQSGHSGMPLHLYMMMASEMYCYIVGMTAWKDIHYWVGVSYCSKHFTTSSLWIDLIFLYCYLWLKQPKLLVITLVQI